MKSNQYPYLKVQDIELAYGTDMQLVMGSAERDRAVRFALESTRGHLLLVDELQSQALQWNLSAFVGALLCKIVSNHVGENGKLYVHLVTLDKVTVEHYSKGISNGFVDIACIRELEDVSDFNLTSALDVSQIVMSMLRSAEALSL